MTFDTQGTRESMSGTDFQDSFKIDQGSVLTDVSTEGADSRPNRLNDGQLADWLGGRDSNPDNVVQSHVSYR